MTAFSTEHDTFRNELASVARDGRRRWVYARQPSGRLYRARTVLSWFLLAFLLFAPFIRVGGQPLMLLDILHRHFVLLGVVFRPQDFYLVVLIALTLLVTLVLTTVVFGRIWCGWLCPQTVFMEMLFRKLEFLIEGSAESQLRRNRRPWTTENSIRKVVKHALFFGLSFVIANVFLAWIIGASELKTIVTDPPRQHFVGLGAIVVFSFLFYMVFARFREQACVLACPYGRVLSALTDSRTITVTYDARRGEPRSRLIRRDGVDATGDCIDCHQCVTVCPTGIDIRDGIQLECVNCTACIDACNGVMRRLGRPAGLIRLTSHDAVTGAVNVPPQAANARCARGPRARQPSGAGHRGPRERRCGGGLPGQAHRLGHDARRPLFNARLTARAAAYGVVWLVLVFSVAVLLVSRRELDVLILRQPGTLYAATTDADVANFYNVQAFNRTGHVTQFAIEIVEPRGATVTSLGRFDTVEPYGLLEGRLLLRVPQAALRASTTPVRFAVRTRDGVVQIIESAFLGPAVPAARTNQD